MPINLDYSKCTLGWIDLTDFKIHTQFKYRTDCVKKHVLHSGVCGNDKVMMPQVKFPRALQMPLGVNFKVD